MNSEVKFIFNLKNWEDNFDKCISKLDDWKGLND